MLLGTEAVRKKLGIGQATIYRMIHRGDIPAVRVGGQWKYDSREIDRWLEKNRVDVK